MMTGFRTTTLQRFISFDPFRLAKWIMIHFLYVTVDGMLGGGKADSGSLLEVITT